MAAEREPYWFLDDPAERAWLVDLSSAAVLANAHRMYDWMVEQSVDPDSFLRELAFQKAASEMGLDYDVLYDAWLAERPVAAA